MTQGEVQEISYRIQILEMAGTHCGENATEETVMARAAAYLTFVDAGREKAFDKKES